MTETKVGMIAKPGKSLLLYSFEWLSFTQSLPLIGDSRRKWVYSSTVYYYYPMTHIHFQQQRGRMFPIRLEGIQLLRPDGAIHHVVIEGGRHGTTRRFLGTLVLLRPLSRHWPRQH
jgi:hypothetical protein